ncbi:uncharacterized protein JCM15063_006305 [Sporobolomyces koalae]|uniref:uncharacterized protein n=1 Tax=Sporobolomyces koalae TaxID=500713 RepID=UPI0031718E10
MSPLDLAQPRRILPLANHAPSQSTPASASASGSSHASLQIKLSKPILDQLVQLARSQGTTGSRSKLQLDCTDPARPLLVIDGARYPLEMHKVSQPTDVCHLTQNSRDVHTLARLTHRATLATSQADGREAVTKAERMAKASLNLKLKREQELRDKESKKAVLLDPTSSSSSARKQPHSSPPSTASRSAATAQPKHAARLIPTTTSATKSPVPPPSTTSASRIGKGTVPQSIIARSTSSTTSASSSSASSPAPSPAELPSSTTTSATTGVPAPTRQFSSSSSTSTSTSALSDSSTFSIMGTNGTGTMSETSPESITSLLPASTTATIKHGAKPTVEVVVKQKSVPTVPVAGRGGLMKGKDSLKREARRQQQVKDRGSKEREKPKNLSSEPKRSAKEKDSEMEETGEDEDADGEVDDELLLPPPTPLVLPPIPSAPSSSSASSKRKEEEGDHDRFPKKKRKLSNGNGTVTGKDEGDRQREKVPGQHSPIKTIIKKVVAPSTSTSNPVSASSDLSKPAHRRSTVTSGAGKEKEKERQTDPSTTKQKKRKTTTATTNRWYSSSDEDEPSHVKSGPDRSQQPQPSSTSTTVPNDSISSKFDASRSTFFELYASYAVLHSRLSTMRSDLVHQPSTITTIKESPTELRQLVDECASKRKQLERLKEEMTGLSVSSLQST